MSLSLHCQNIIFLIFFFSKHSFNIDYERYIDYENTSKRHHAKINTWSTSISVKAESYFDYLTRSIKSNLITKFIDECLETRTN